MLLHVAFTPYSSKKLTYLISLVLRTLFHCVLQQHLAIAIERHIRLLQNDGRQRRYLVNVGNGDQDRLGSGLRQQHYPVREIDRPFDGSADGDIAEHSKLVI